MMLSESSLFLLLEVHVLVTTEVRPPLRDSGERKLFRSRARRSGSSSSTTEPDESDMTQGCVSFRRSYTKLAQSEFSRWQQSRQHVWKKDN